MLNVSPGKTGFWRLIRERFVKIYPLYFIGLLIGIAIDIINPHSILSMPERSIASIANLFLQPVFLKSSEAVFPFNAPTWAIILELYVFAIFVLFRFRLNRRILLGLCIGAATLFVLLALHWHNSNLGWSVKGYIGGFPRVVFGFFGGILLSRVIGNFNQHLFRLHPLIVWSMFIAVHFISTRSLSLPLLFLAVPIVVSLAAVSLNPKWLISFCKQSGRLAYAIYLLHFPILTLFHIFVGGLYKPGNEVDNVINYITLLTLVILAAYFITRFIDEPLQHKLGNFFKEKKINGVCLSNT
jgi:peptidoglycan/LPS O-acetylase OafA/YrhL